MEMQRKMQKKGTEKLYSSDKSKDMLVVMTAKILINQASV